MKSLPLRCPGENTVQLRRGHWWEKPELPAEQAGQEEEPVALTERA